MAKVKAVKYIGKQDVYNMEVEKYHNFSINGGLVVHNCTYGLCAWHAEHSEQPPPPKSELQKFKDQLARRSVWRVQRGILLS